VPEDEGLDKASTNQSIEANWRDRARALLVDRRLQARRHNSGRRGDRRVADVRGARTSSFSYSACRIARS